MNSIDQHVNVWALKTFKSSLFQSFLGLKELICSLSQQLGLIFYISQGHGDDNNDHPDKP